MPGLDETVNQFRWRVRDPKDFLSNTYRAKDLGSEGISSVLGKLVESKVPEGNDPDSMILQSYRFDKRKGWKRDKVMGWLKGKGVVKSMSKEEEGRVISPEELKQITQVQELLKEEIFGTEPQQFEVEAEIFAVGTWNGGKISLADLEELRVNFELLKPHLVPALKLGHSEKQKLIAQPDGDPALGWIESLRIEGNKLIALFKGVPEIVKNLIDAKRYRKVSSEIYFGFKWQSKNLGKVLKAVALLGADMPAVTTLDDMKILLTEAQGCEVKTFDFGPEVEVEKVPDENKLRDENTRLETELVKLRQFKIDQETAEVERAKLEIEQLFTEQKNKLLGFCKEKIKAGKLKPSALGVVEVGIETQREVFSHTRNLGIPLELLNELSEQKTELFRETASNVTDETGDNNTARGDQFFAEEIQKYAFENKLSYMEAAKQVASLKPGAYRAYVKSIDAIYDGRLN